MTKPTSIIETIARGFLVSPRGVLVCSPASRVNCYLPGGHIEFGETGATALARELCEELGVRITVHEFLGAGENAFEQKKGEIHHEINLYYRMTCATIARRATLTSLEQHINFAWLPVDAFEDANLLPISLHSLIPHWLRDGLPRYSTDGLPLK